MNKIDFLNKVGGIENKAFIKIDNEVIKSTPEADVERTSSDGKASSVHFIHFNSLYFNLFCLSFNTY